MKLRQTKSSKGALASPALLVVGGLISMNAHGMVPVDFGEWSATSAGIITTTCPTNYTCTVEVSDNNFYQEVMRENTPGGNVFYRQIISESDLTNESIVRINNGQSSVYARHGIANKQSLSSAQTTANANTNFTSDATIYTGWASPAGSPDLQITQNIDEVFRKAGAGSTYLEGKFSSVANINANYDADGNRTGLDFSINQSNEEPGQYGASSGGSRGGGSSGGYTEIDSQVFAMRGLEGDLLTSGGTVSLSTGSLSFNASDSLWGHAIGQNMHHSSLTGGGTQLDGGSSPAGYEDLGMSFESYDNRSDSSAAINYFAYFGSEATGWPSIFGAAPDLPAPTGNNGGSSTGAGPSPTLVSSLFTPTAVGPAQDDGRDAPIDFGQWTVEGGTLTAEGVLAAPVDASAGVSPTTGLWVKGGDGTVMPECAAGVVCATGSIDAPGMVQRIVTDSEGRRYIQSILTDLDTGFSTESYVAMGEPSDIDGSSSYFTGQWVAGYDENTAESGISMRMVMAQDTSSTGVAGSVNSEVVINTGWAARSASPNVAITQDISETGPVSGTTYDQNFAYNGNMDANGNTIGSKVDIDQVGMNLARSYNSRYSSSTSDELRFAHRSRAGNLQDTSGSGGDISWSNGDAITATWIYNSFSSGQTSGFGAVFYDNLVDSAGYSDVGWDYDGYSGLGSNWLSSAFGDAPAGPTGGGTSGGGGGRR